MKKQLLCVLLLLAGDFLMAQTTIVQWNFNSASSFTVAANGMAPDPSLGTGKINLIGGVTAMNASGVNPPDGGTSFNKALNTTTYPATSQATNRKTAGILITASTTGYTSVHLTYYTQHSGTAANTVAVQYLAGSTWQDITSYAVSTASSFLSQKDIDLSGIPALNNRDTVQLRLVTDFGNATSYLPVSSANYMSSGTIRYDLITLSGNAISCGTLATQQATGLRLLKTDNTLAQLGLNRGNGTGCLMLCSNAGIPSAPVNGTNYTANTTYGSGAAVGNAFTVYNTQINNPSTHYFNIDGLIAGTKYYVAAYEYSSSGYCYLTPGTIDSFYCNSTILYPGDIQFVGFDNAVATGGVDAYAITNLKPVNRGTSFQIVNSRYEAGAATNVRTQRWYSGGNNINDDLEIINVLYTAATPLPAGSVLSFDFDGYNSISNIKIGTAPSTSFTITSNTNNSLLNSNNPPDPEQLFLTQGKFTPTGTYSLLEGHVLHGISLSKPWVDFSQACSGANAASSRESRLPPDIKCLNLYFPTGTDYAYYKVSALHNSSQGAILGQLANTGNWTSANTTGTSNDIATIYNAPFTLSPSPTTANWTGGVSTNWFNCSNWENLYVPDSTANVSVATTIPAAIDLSNSLSAEYSNLASVRNLSITNTVTLNGASADKLIVYDSLTISNGGSLITSGATTDTVVVRGSIRSDNTNGLQLSTNGWLSMNGNRQLQAIPVSLASATPVGVAALSLNNPPGININNGGFESLQKLDLTNGVLVPGVNGFHYMAAGCTISSPINLYNELNKGWEKSYIEGKVFIRTNSTGEYFAPLGSKLKGTFSPMIIQPRFGGAVYEAGYVGMSYPNVGPADVNNPPIRKVSNQEYWTLTSQSSNADASLTLYYTPGSFVAGAQGTDPQALADLRIVQYWDTSASMSPKWKFPTVPVAYSTSGTVQYGKISMPGYYASSLREADKNFTLGSSMGINTLPLQIVSWQAQLQATRTRLGWQVQQEAGTAFYTVEKSIDGKAFRSMQPVYAAGLPAYTCFDETPVDGWNYYRLKITDIDGKVSYTTIEKVWLKHAATFAVFPNPASDKAFISLPSAAQATVSLYAPDGRKCLEQSVAASFTQLSVKGLSAGWYLLEYTDGKNRMTQKLLIK